MVVINLQYRYQIMLLYTLKEHNIICQYYLNKTENKKRKREESRLNKDEVVEIMSLMTGCGR